jgi:preprotein translocase subunit SecB
MISPLQLKDHRFTKVQVEAVSHGLPNGKAKVTTKCTWEHNTENLREWRVKLTVEYGPEDNHPEGPYKGILEIVGVFEVAENFPEKDIEKLVRINGASVLYGAIREMLLNITSRSSHGGFRLPTFRFADAPSTRAPKEKTPDKRSTKTPKPR